MSKHIVPIELTNKLKRWNYGRSVEKMRDIVKQWKRLTVEAVRELYLAKEYLTNQEGQRRDPEAPNYILYSWGDYCEEIRFPRQLADYYIKKFQPKELSFDGKDALLLEAPKKEETVTDRALFEARIAEVLRTGKRPKDFTDKEEAELAKRQANARYLKFAEELNAPAVARTKTDYFAETMRRSKDIVNFKLESREQILAQAAIFDHIESYLKTFENPEVKARAAFNLALKTRNRANELAEQNYQLSESASEKEAGHDG